MEIERIADWRGARVIDPSGERIGELEDTFSEGEGAPALFASVWTALLGRCLVFVPLAGASAGRDYIRLAVGRALIERAPAVGEKDGISAAGVRALLTHYGLGSPRASELRSDRFDEDPAAERERKLEKAARLEAEAREVSERVRTARAAAARVVAEERGALARGGSGEADNAGIRGAKDVGEEGRRSGPPGDAEG